MKSNELSPEDVLQLFQEAMRSEIYADNQISELYGRLNSVLLIVPHIVKERLAQFDTMIFQDKKQISQDVQLFLNFSGGRLIHSININPDLVEIMADFHSFCSTIVIDTRRLPFEIQKILIRPTNNSEDIYFNKENESNNECPLSLIHVAIEAEKVTSGGLLNCLNELRKQAFWMSQERAKFSYRRWKYLNKKKLIAERSLMKRKRTRNEMENRNEMEKDDMDQKENEQLAPRMIFEEESEAVALYEMLRSAAELTQNIVSLQQIDKLEPQSIKMTENDERDLYQIKPLSVAQLINWVQS
ncbi:MAG: hypothetical protein EZS28_022005 [Streblomastix strix]|uniref:Uncharacterized protein n=1 Tax=Streblomastix strix TaxID=222440 RepID=A0A5J4VIP9_9EUKA|nr:MAG: hypothetical protein EZS28_022005 [Streblomastix strix]